MYVFFFSLHNVLRLLTGLLLLLLLLAYQHPAPDMPAYGPPLQGTLLLTGTFGELRASHYHGGIDLRGSVGTPVYSIGDGYVSRIVIDESGYGQALYVTHPEGYTSVYGHLHSLVDTLLAYARNQQYAQERFAVDLVLDSSQFVVQRGQQIGTVGNRGASQGPHLHLEIRDTYTEQRINPLLFGYQVADTRQPQTRQLRIYDLDARGNVLATKDYPLRAAAQGEWQPNEGDTLYTTAAQVGIGLKTYDQLNGLNNLNGTYQVTLYDDFGLQYAVRFDTLGEDQRQDYSALIDFPAQRRGQGFYHRLFQLPGLGRDAASGIIDLQLGEARPLRLVARDVAGNERVVNWVLARVAGYVPTLTRHYQYVLPYHEASLIDNGQMRVFLPPESLYEDAFLTYQQVIDDSEGVYSVVHLLHDPSVPLRHAFSVGLRPQGLPDSLWDKAIVAYCYRGSRPINYGGRWQDDGRLYTQSRQLGDFCIMVDTVPPQVRPLNFRADLRRSAELSFRISDNFGTGGTAQGLRYRATVDGAFFLLEYDRKSQRLFHTFDGRLPAGQHEMRLEVTDDRNNTTVWTGSFRR